ncbi:hypothetical protein NO042_660044 [Flavobacterium psychrophilum]|nr:hypothetical protein NO042_660044 [Flavobacterium psychrophilum]
MFLKEKQKGFSLLSGLGKPVIIHYYFKIRVNLCNSYSKKPSLFYTFTPH